MKEIRCTACGSPDMVRKGDFYICQHCGTKYELTYEDFLHNKDYYKGEELSDGSLENTSDAIEQPDVSAAEVYNPGMFKKANLRCFFTKVFSGPSLQYNEFLLAIILIVSAWVFFKFEFTVLVGALCCFVSIGLLLHFLFRLMFNFGYYNNRNIRDKDREIVIRYAAKVWEANNKEEIRKTVAEFEQEKTKLKNEYLTIK